MAHSIEQLKEVLIGHLYFASIFKTDFDYVLWHLKEKFTITFN